MTKVSKRIRQKLRDAISLPRERPVSASECVARATLATTCVPLSLPELIQRHQPNLHRITLPFTFDTNLRICVNQLCAQLGYKRQTSLTESSNRNNDPTKILAYAKIQAASCE